MKRINVGNYFLKFYSFQTANKLKRFICLKRLERFRFRGFTLNF